MTRAALQRYRIADEPRDPPFARLAISPIWVLLPLTTYLALFWSPLFWLLPGANGFLVAGRHRWRDLALSVVALGVAFAWFLIVGELRRRSVTPGLWLPYARDLALALTVLPLIRVMMDQQATIDLRRALRP